MELAVLLDTIDEDILELQRVITQINPSMKYEIFHSVEEFASWFQNLSENPPEDDFTFSLLISNRRLLGGRHASLFEKIDQFLHLKGYLPEGKTRLPLLVTAMNSTELNLSAYKNKIFDNIIFKPFDEAVCRGKIHWAVEGHDALGNEELHKQKPVSPLEMLKDVRIDRITELGFRSISTKEIDTGVIARYYLPSLKPLGSDYGVYASCSYIKKIDDGPESGKFYCSFSFFGLDSHKARNIRKLIDQAGHSNEIPITEVETTQRTGIVVLAEEKDLCERLEAALTASFDEIDLAVYSNLIDFTSEFNSDVALTEWLETVEDTDPLVLEYQVPDGIFLSSKTQSGEEKESFAGLDKGQLIGLKPLLMASAPEVQRAAISAFWARAVSHPLALQLEIANKPFFITLEKSELVEKDENGPKRMQIHLRTCKSEELDASGTSKKTLPEDVELVIISESFAARRDDEFWQEAFSRICKKPLDLRRILIGRSRLELFEQAKSFEKYTDYLVDPFDQTYLKKKIKFSLPTIKTQAENASRFCLETDEVIKVGTQVNVKNFSEVSLSIQYHRELEEGVFREFVIYIQREKEYEELLAKLVDAEADPDEKNTFINHFTLFGHGDKTNQRIREWLGEQYSLSKQEEMG